MKQKRGDMVNILHLLPPMVNKSRLWSHMDQQSEWLLVFDVEACGTALQALQSLTLSGLQVDVVPFEEARLEDAPTHASKDPTC